MGQWALYCQYMLTMASGLDVMHRLGRALADPTRSRILMQVHGGGRFPALLARNLAALIVVSLAVDESAPCPDPACTVPGSREEAAR